MAHNNEPISAVGGPQLGNVVDRYADYNTSVTETRTVTTQNNPLKTNFVTQLYQSTASRHVATVDLTSLDAFKGTKGLGLYQINYNADSPFSPYAVGDLKGAYNEFGELIPKGQNLMYYG